VNVENILKVADAIEKHSIPDLGFNMSYAFDAVGPEDDRSGHSCGTVACIGGWTNVVLAKSGNLPIAAAQRRLELTDRQADALFYPLGYWRVDNDYTPSQAVAVLRHLAATGEVDWTIQPSPEAA